MGDLISRKTVLEELHARGRELQKLSVTSFEKAISLGVAYECVSIVKDAPAVDAKPVRHGRWRMDTNPNSWYFGTVSCSECSYTNDCGITPYCPNCGAKMDKEENA